MTSRSWKGVPTRCPHLPSMKTIAALFVQANGCYADLEGVEAWGLPMDAREYPGPHPVVAHPPCARWSNFWYGSPSPHAPQRFERGDDDGCFSSAIASVQKWGGVLEHPRGSSAWGFHNIACPPRAGGWVSAGMYAPGWTCCVEQGHYGHRARKATWLYCVGPEPPPLIWGASESTCVVELHSHKERAATPPEFRDLLLALARP